MGTVGRPPNIPERDLRVRFENGLHQIMKAYKEGKGPDVMAARAIEALNVNWNGKVEEDDVAREAEAI